MGTVFSIDLRDEGDWRPAVDAVVAWLHHVDRVFSTYRHDSDITRLQLGELTVADADPLVAEVLALCASYERSTGGWFTAAWNGGVDPTGLVKGWAVERASGILRDHGSHDHAVNGGGDVQTSGSAGPGQPWRIGVTDPADRASVLATFVGSGIAVATSGTAERGDHILDPTTGGPARALRSATVSGRSLTDVDVYATAAFAMGARAAEWLADQPGTTALLVRQDGTRVFVEPTP